MSGECDGCGEHAMDCDCKFGKWISVKDRLPADNEVVLFCDGIYVYRGTRSWYDPGYRWFPDGYWNYLDEAITYWMPLPSPPNHFPDATNKVD